MSYLVRDARRPGLAAVLACAGVVLVPWSAVLAHTLPSTYAARNWSSAWAGLDLAMAGGALLTARLYRRGDRRTAVVAAATGTAALVDLWFDVLTSSPGPDLAQALVCGLVEIVFAGYCWAVALRPCAWSAMDDGGVRTEPAGSDHAGSDHAGSDHAGSFSGDGPDARLASAEAGVPTVQTRLDE
jgi:hypothetical protein